MGSCRHSGIMQLLGLLLTISALSLTHADDIYECPGNGAQHAVIGAGEEFKFQAKKNVERCYVHVTLDSSCSQMELTCHPFFLPNKDPPPSCKQGDKMVVKADGLKPVKYCEMETPIKYYPKSREVHEGHLPLQAYARHVSQQGSY